MSEKANLTGQIKIADEVFANIVSAAVLEAEGVAGMGGQAVSDYLRGKPAKGVKLSVIEENVKITLDIMVKSGTKIQEVALDVQQRVKTAIETMTGFEANEVNIQVVGLVV